MQSIILVISLILDSFVASIGYGIEKIKIPLKTIFLINFISTFVLFLSMSVGNLLNNFIPAKFLNKISFFIFLSLGIYKIFEVLFKQLIYKISKKTNLSFKISDINFVLNVYIDETLADIDNSKTLSIKEAIYLSIALSLDSLLVGIGISFLNINYIYIIILCFTLGILSFILGTLLGKLLINKKNLNLSWLSGVFLIIIAIGKI